MDTVKFHAGRLEAGGLDFFLQNGFLHLPGRVPPVLLQKLRDLFDDLLSSDNPDEEKVVIESQGKKYVTNLENICHKGNLSCLELLGSPSILSIAASICGPDFFLIQEFAVIKWAGDQTPVHWHQDMVHQRSGNCFTMGIYLDDTPVNEGALRIIPKSHLDNRDICELSKEEFTELPMQAGDLLLHDMMLAHSSGLLHNNPLRRVIYFEFLSAAHVFQESIYSIELVNRRSRLIFAAIRHYRLLHPDEEPFHYIQTHPFPADEEHEIPVILTEIYKDPIHARPSAYCFEDFIPHQHT